MNDKKRYAQKPDAQGFDEIRIFTQPRYKTSGLSGDEWRISGTGQILRKGKVIREFHAGNVNYAAQKLMSEIMLSHDEGQQFFAGGEDGKCDQEGCAELATVTYRVINEYCNQAHSHGPTPLDKEMVLRQFCERHSTRGDCSFDDADENYEIITGSVSTPKPSDESPSVFGGVINL